MVVISNPDDTILAAVFPEKGSTAKPSMNRLKRKRKGSDRGAGWLSDCVRDEKGKPLGNLSNAAQALRGDPALSRLFTFDEFSGTLILENPVPMPGEGHLLPDDDYERRPLTDNDVNRLQEYLQVEGLVRLGRDTTLQAVDIRAHECSHHPVRDYLDGLEWDGTPRVASWLHTYLGCDATLYVSQVGRMFLVSMIARIRDPGCKADYMLVLEGPQGAMKSTVCRILGGDWASDSMPDITSGKDASLHLRGRWLIEIAEMSAITSVKADDALLKAFLTRQVERYRPPYGRIEVEVPRQCIFIGTTNKGVYLRDETGARRYWPVKVGSINALALIRDRDQLFAEAAHLYRQGINWWPSAQFEADHIRPEQEARFDTDVWESLIGEWLCSRNRVTIGDVASGGLGIEGGRISRVDQNRIRACLERLGWIFRRVGGGRYWHRPVSDE